MNHKPFNVIILAGGTGGPLPDATGVAAKAHLNIHNRPMLDWVVDAFSRSPEAGNLVVVGSHHLKKLSCMRKVRKRIFQGHNAIQNLVHAVGYIKARLYKGRKKHQGYIVSFCDAVFLTESIVSETLRNIRDSDADIVLHYVEKSTFQQAGLPAERTYIPVGNGLYTGSAIYYVRDFSKIVSNLGKLYEMRKKRKDPKGLLNAISCEGKDFPAIETALSNYLGAKVRILTSRHAGMGMDVDQPSHYELAQSVLRPFEVKR